MVKIFHWSYVPKTMAFVTNITIGNYYTKIVYFQLSVIYLCEGCVSKRTISKSTMNFIRKDFNPFSALMVRQYDSQIAINATADPDNGKVDVIQFDTLIIGLYKTTNKKERK